MIENVLIVGAGSAGLLAAIALKRKIPALVVQVVRSQEIGVIGVGESTTRQLPRFLFEYLGISKKHFYSIANPTWKMGIHFIWGPRDCFEYSFDFALDAQWSDLPLPNGYYCAEDFSYVNLQGAFMAEGKAFARQPNGGGPGIPSWAAFHLYNPQFVASLEVVAKTLGVEFIDANLTGATRRGDEIESVVLKDGRTLRADLFVDASGFRSELLGKALAEPFVSYDNSLFCDRAIVGSWERGDDFIYPYTVAETMDAGWCWRIDHEHSVNRGYVYSSRFLSDEAAREEFMRKNPKATPWDRVVKFRSGRYRRGWVGNVVGLGNACGFVEPLEATALMAVCGQVQTLTDFLLHSQQSLAPTLVELYNRVFAETWDDIRDFLALHYRFNTRLNTPFWKCCNEEVDISGTTELLKFYRENGPTGLCRHALRNTPGTHNQFGIEGYLVMLVGNRVPYRERRPPTEKERQIWNRHRADNKALARQGMCVQEALACIKDPRWKWFGE
ncbi:MAG TPA: tryptophan 7-halogenase [Phycisphaerae bacterium]|nr:tryptophan 7-halogenase [Phycisphaerae bacterium]